MVQHRTHEPEPVAEVIVDRRLVGGAGGRRDPPQGYRADPFHREQPERSDDQRLAGGVVAGRSGDRSGDRLELCHSRAVVLMPRQ